ncbi:MAG: 3-phosphoglycerate dehydrogenase [Lachnospiraceae bacterium]|uniref:D-3-phosphoglycerate dehydrogenase n=1 Tax=Candidatus Weimeria bifida TaxID=2599074 RepID=A0A6N7IY23_9FIRM|nr:3-phosphoglycerate dehydrogenase [Candidatus Weimeria bifida]RRF96651.1 MAG: 3-phosphoglycerate dehydrogenase [Lachnospiraceae bacterium]
MFKYHTLNAISPKGLVKFSNNYEQTDDANDADAFIVRSAKLHDMEFSDKLSCIARAGAGVNNIPLDKCADKGIVVFNTPGANANAVKELVFTGMLLASRDILGSVNWVNENKDDADISKDMEKAKKQFAGRELAGKKLGVIGLGAIGQRVANTATHLGMDVLGYDPYISVNAAWNLSRNVKHIANVDDIYRECDFITIHVPLLDSTKGMINADAVSKMKQGVVILNYARDLLVDEKAVLDGIKLGKIKHYMTDFPNPATAGQPGVIATSHLGASTAEAEENCAMMAVDEIMDYLENGNIRHSVNYPDCDMGPVTSKGRLAVLHYNKSGLIAKYTTILGDANINVSDLTNKSRGDYAYSLIDTDSEVTADVVAKLNSIPDVIRVRVVR